MKGIDTIDGTPLLDIKPYTRSDCKEKAKFGWLGEKKTAENQNRLVKEVRK